MGRVRDVCSWCPGILEIAVSAACFSAAPTAAAQSFNVDFDVVPLIPGYDPPASGYGAAAGQPGAWNSVLNRFPRTLVDLDGEATPVTFEAQGASSTNGFDHPFTVDDRGRLLDDFLDVSFPGPVEIVVTGLESGRYEVYTYGITPDGAEFRTYVNVLRAAVESATMGGPMPATGFVEGLTHCRHRVDIARGHALRIVCDEAPPSELGSINGLQIKRAGPSCFGDHDFDGTITVQDLFNFLADWFAMAPQADVSGDAMVSVQDIFDFLDAYFEGC